MEASGAPENIARYLSGMWPARLGLQKTRPIPRKLAQIVPIHSGEQIQGYAFYHCRELTDLAGDFLVFTDRNLYVIPIYATRQSPVSLNPTAAYVDYSMTDRGQTFTLAVTSGYDKYSKGTPFQVAPNGMETSDWPAAGFAAGTINNICFAQFGNELLFSMGNTGTFGGSAGGNNIWRYYREFAGAGILKQHLYYNYIPAGGQPSILGHSVPRDPDTHLTGTYQYAWTWIDELGRESSPSVSVTIAGLSNENVTVQRGTTTTYTATAPLAGWYLYRRNPGAEVFYRVKATAIAVATTTYVDSAADASITGFPVMPEAGENDPADTCTYMIEHKGRVVMNSLYNFGVVQMSNSGSPTQFASLTLPTNTADGIRVEVGNDAEHVITGLESIGDLLWISKPSSYYLLQGSDINSWDLQQVGKNRGCDNFFSVQRTEELIMFRSGDGVYGLSYQAGMVSPKMSWQIDDLLGGFATPRIEGERYDGVFNPGMTDGNVIGEPMASSVQAQYIDWARSFYWQQRYFLSLPDRTLVFDMLTKEWGDSGLGPVKWATTGSAFQAYSVSGTPFGGLPDLVFFSSGGSYSGDLDIYYFSSIDTPYDDVTSTYTMPYVGREITHNFDPSQVPLSGRMRGKCLTLYGETGKRRGAKLGHVQFIADGRKCAGPIPIIAYQTRDKEGALCQIGCPNDYVGQELYAEFVWTTNDVVVGKRLLELVRTN